MIRYKSCRRNQDVINLLQTFIDNGYTLTEYFINVVPISDVHASFTLSDEFGVFYDERYTRHKQILFDDGDINVGGSATESCPTVSGVMKIANELCSKTYY